MIDFTTISNACVKCGKCIPYCTIYRIHREEVTSPRGYLDLVGAYARGDLTIDNLTKDFFESCFLCTTCVEVCPSHLGIDEAIEKIRIDIAKQYGIKWYKKLYFFLLKHRKLMDIVFSMVAFIAPCAFKTTSNGSKIPLSKRVVFPFRRQSFLAKYKGEIASSVPKRQNLTHNKVAIFIGCLANYNYMGVGESLLVILDRLGIDVLIPKQECCGAPAFFTGDIATVLTLIKRNIEYFEHFIDKVDAILIPEATCAAMLMKDWANALRNDKDGDIYLKRLAKITPKMAMASHWLYHHTDLEILLDSSGGATRLTLDCSSQNLAPSKERTITYHDPCHAKKVLKIYKEPRALLRKGYHIVEMSEADRCCGFGGVSMQSDRYHLTLKAGAPKAQMIGATNASIVSAECSACRMQITNALAQDNIQVQFAHPLELIAKSFQEQNQ